MNTGRIKMRTGDFDIVSVRIFLIASILKDHIVMQIKALPLLKKEEEEASCNLIKLIIGNFSVLA